MTDLYIYHDTFVTCLTNILTFLQIKKKNQIQYDNTIQVFITINRSIQYNKSLTKYRLAVMTFSTLIIE